MNRLHGFVRESLATLTCREYSKRSPVDPPVPDTPQGVKTASVHFEAEEASLLPEASRITFRRYTWAGQNWGCTVETPYDSFLICSAR